jgi:hypothetical protein
LEYSSNSSFNHTEQELILITGMIDLTNENDDYISCPSCDKSPLQPSDIKKCKGCNQPICWTCSGDGDAEDNFNLCQKCVPTKDMEKESESSEQVVPPRQTLEPLNGKLLVLSQKDMQSLSPLTWFNDTIINAFFSRMVAQWGENFVGRLSSFALPAKETENKNLWKVEPGVLNLGATHLLIYYLLAIYNCQILFVPINVGNWHWTLLICDWKNIWYYDSLEFNPKFSDKNIAAQKVCN